MAECKNSPLKILMTTDTVGGVWTYCMELCKALQDENIHFYLITTGALMKEGQRREAASLKNIIVYETTYLLEWMENPWQDIQASSEFLLQLAEEIKPDIVHLNCFCYGALPFKAPVVVVAHSDVWSWWLSVHNTHPPAEWNEYYYRVKEGLNGADLIITPSKSMLRQLREIYFPNAPRKVIYNTRSHEFFQSAPKEKFIFTMGRIWDEAKNLKLIVEAAWYLEYPVRVAGENKLGSNGIEVPQTDISYLGFLHAEQIKAQLAAASVYCLPAKYEPFGLSILEAALSGCALVLGDIDSLREIWQDNALFVDTNDAVALADQLNYLLEHDTACKHFSDKAYTHALKFSTHLMAEQYREVYQQLIKTKQPLTTKAA
ncbi:MAG: glycosyltransferase family 4 protein [Flavisolibacter sp.]|nr:glycosyltransferase family 4 protein [Flavisolibacter sp.]